MQIEGAVIKEQNTTFAVVVVKREVLSDLYRAQDAIRSFSPIFPGIPIVLMAQDHRGTPSYYGRSDISKFMASVPLQAIPWRRYDIH
ncbi:hypothetical protein [Asaia sp. As-1742]|uniref:hypothetical protein n=1 Tax=Asaia sp. As-1742 TaxID=2608325 RepID=UPI001420900E|nr:hypothetical protein [Asaia sp. As-1742]NIE81392.1 hypothetical protein [Asaia sp. As-1742]